MNNNTIEVRILIAGAVHNGQAYRKGDLVEVDDVTAIAWTKAGRATYTNKVRALRDVFEGSTFYNAGDVFEVCNDRATLLHNSGAVELLTPLRDASKLTTPRDIVKRTEAKPDPFNGEPRVAVRVLKTVVWDLTVYDGEDKPSVIELPESRARREIAAGNAEPAGLIPQAAAAAHDLGRAMRRAVAS